jgi:hypothetical protein
VTAIAASSIVVGEVEEEEREIESFERRLELRLEQLESRLATLERLARMAAGQSGDEDVNPDPSRPEKPTGT